ncbi:MAG: pyridoxamine 5'-phosphate oxidase family protein [Candidatus Methanomethylophilus sp.]|nr:pyridoxamine 5'-phosphate oxidase family protein [Methanomethylophilus sp.]MDD4668845.1 pyridoxamine 5'-phosphate oxidase family protein [Methanomethylophilus sp.]
MSTVNEDGCAHSIVLGSVLVPDQETIAIGRVWVKTTGKNLNRDPRAEFLFFSGKTAYSVVCDLVESSSEGPMIEQINQYLSRMRMSTASVWLFKVKAVFDEGISENTGSQII